ncbi:MAG: hypothetical protein ACI8RE_000259, partial [Ilumatobacter sp.]
RKAEATQLPQHFRPGKTATVTDNRESAAI